MADRITPLMLDALGRALAEPEGMPLFGSRARAGLFSNSAAGKQAAKRCLDEQLLEVRHASGPGRTADLYTATERGLAVLVDQASPRQMLQDLVRAVEVRQRQVAELVACARQMQATTDALHATTESALRKVQRNEAPWKAAVIAHLEEWQAPGDCPLPDLFRHGRRTAPELTIGEFHDGLRQLHHGEQIYLHPWTGPLYAIPEPPYALLVGHEVAYYASPRRMAG